VDAPVYLFTASGKYLSRSVRTDSAGRAEFLVPDQIYKFRVDHDGIQCWTDEIPIIPHEENQIDVSLDQLALSPTNNPNPVRFDSTPQPYDGQEIRVASIGDLTGILAQSTVASTPTHAVYYYINDHLGTTQTVIDKQGQIVWKAEYMPFGKAEVVSETITNNFRFPGQYNDRETEINYNYHRYYNPVIGKYLVPDPLGFGGGINLFSYVWANPITYFDYFGLAKGDWWDIRTYVSISLSHTWIGRGVTISEGIEQKTLSPLTLGGTSIDISIGSLPSPKDFVYSYGLGVSKHLGISHFYGRPDPRGRYEVGGLTIHIGVGFGAPFFASQTFPDSNIMFSDLSDKELYFENDSRCAQRVNLGGLHDI
jgi:RHS repeat-associated protein